VSVVSKARITTEPPTGGELSGANRSPEGELNEVKSAPAVRYYRNRKTKNSIINNNKGELLFPKDEFGKKS
jgi:hypothetical protein